jgi:integrase
MAKIKKVVNKTGGVSWNVDYRNPQGKRVQKRFSRKGKAEEYLARVMVSIRENKYGTIVEKTVLQITFNELADKYAGVCRFDKSYPTFKGRIIPVLRAAFGDRLLSQISSLDMENYRNARRAGISRRGTVRSAARVNRELAVLKNMLNKAVRRGFLKSSPFAKFSKDDPIMFKEEGGRLRYLTEEECEALLAQCSPYLRPIVKMAVNTGMRKGEVLALRWEHIGHESAYIYKSKSGKPRVVPLNEAALEVVREMRQNNQLRPPSVFCDKAGRPWRELKDGFAAACRRASIVDFRFHDLRHTFASHLAMNGFSMKAIADLLGHTLSRHGDALCPSFPGPLAGGRQFPALWEKWKNFGKLSPKKTRGRDPRRSPTPHQSWCRRRDSNSHRPKPGGF